MSTVTRDLYSMREAHILYVEYRNNRRYYSINYDTLDLLINHLNYLRLSQGAHLTNPPGEDWTPHLARPP